MKEALPSETTTNIPLLLKADNQGFIALAHNSVFYGQTKQINIQYHYIKDKVATCHVIACDPVTWPHWFYNTVL